MRARNAIKIGLVLILTACFGCGCMETRKQQAETDDEPSAPQKAEVGPDALRILCFGDSITQGSGAEFQGGYRSPLKKLLTEAGVKCDFVGGRKTHGLADGEHEGDGGRRMSRLTRREVRDIFKANRNPDIILLLLGINDLIENRNTVEATVLRMDSLLEQLAQNATKARIIVGNLVPNASDNPVNGYDPAGTYVDSEHKVLQFNKRLVKVIDSKRAAGTNVQLADLHSRLDREDLCDGIHPNRDGYMKIADAWFKAIIAGRTDVAGGTVPSSQPQAKSTQSSYTMMGNVNSYLKDGNSITFDCENGRVKLSFLTEAIVRVHMAPADKEFPKDDLHLDENGPYAIITYTWPGGSTYTMYDCETVKSPIEKTTFKCSEDETKKEVSISKSNVVYELWVHCDERPASVAADSKTLPRLEDKSSYDTAKQGWYYGPGCFYGSDKIKTVNIKIPKSTRSHLIRITK